MSTNAELFLLLVLLYLYDCSVLLYADEAVLTRDRRGRWTAVTGWPGFVFAGRALCILNPFTPQRAAFRLGWRLESMDEQVELRAWVQDADRTDILAPTTAASALGLFGLVPLGLFTVAGVYALVAGLTLVYLSAVLALIRVSRAGLLPAAQARRMAGFAFECLACPPFAVNMARRITLARSIKEPFPLAAVRLLAAPEWEVMRSHCLTRLDEAIVLETVNSGAATALEAQKRRLRELAQPL